MVVVGNVRSGVAGANAQSNADSAADDAADAVVVSQRLFRVSGRSGNSFWVVAPSGEAAVRVAVVLGRVRVAASAVVSDCTSFGYSAVGLAELLAAPPLRLQV